MVAPGELPLMQGKGERITADTVQILVFRSQRSEPFEARDHFGSDVVGGPFTQVGAYSGGRNVMGRRSMPARRCGSPFGHAKPRMGNIAARIMA